MPLLPLIWSVMSNPIALMIIIAIASFGYGHHRATNACNDRIATERARALQLHMVEMARQAKAAETIEMADRNRAAEAKKIDDAMQAVIEPVKKKVESNAKSGGCVIDGDYVKRVQRLDRAGRH